MDNPILLTTFDYLHLTATITWIGGMYFNFLVLIPSVKASLDEKNTGLLLGNVFKRIKIIVYVSLIILFVTGIPMKIASEYYVSIINFDNTWELVLFIKHALIGILALLAIYNFEFVIPGIKRAAMNGNNALVVSYKKKQMILGPVSFLLGNIIVLLSVVMNYL